MRLLAPALICFSLAMSPVAVQGAQVSIRSLPVPVATIMPGEVIAPEQLLMRRFKTTPESLAGIATESADVVGKEARGRLIAGKPIVIAKLGIPVLVRRGARVTAHYREEGFSISTSVIALSDGSAGSIIDARGVETGAIVKVEILEDGELVIAGQ